MLLLRRPNLLLIHSAKGSTWEEHKYLKRIDGTYYYPDSYEGGRHLSDLEDKKKTDESKEEQEKLDLNETDIENLANEVIRGNFGNGQIRKDLLGANYQEVQDKVNEILRTKAKNRKISEVSEEETKKGKEAIKKATSTKTSKGIDLDRVFSVYRKGKQ